MDCFSCDYLRLFNRVGYIVPSQDWSASGDGLACNGEPLLTVDLWSLNCVQTFSSASTLLSVAFNCSSALLCWSLSSCSSSSTESCNFRSKVQLFLAMARIIAFLLADVLTVFTLHKLTESSGLTSLSSV